MGFYLVRPRQGITFNRTTWLQLLRLAEKYGWKPMGTSGSGHYVFNQGDWVLARDARSLAAALNRAYKKLSPEDTMLPKQKPDGSPKRGRRITLEDYFSGDAGRKPVRDCLAFCRRGTFEIW